MTAASIQLSVITNTWQRPKHLAGLLQQLSRQSLGGLSIEHLVISDGLDPIAAALVKNSTSRYFELEAHQGCYGVAAKDLGISRAQGEYVCLWDDDNLYEPHALAALYCSASGHDIGIVQAEHWSVTNRRYVQIPRNWTGKVQPGDIDTMCLCVRAELAKSIPWNLPPHKRGMDHRWLNRLLAEPRDVHHVEIVIGKHLTF
ncbi:glycosyltransferase family A protein [uncultured Rubinisphaera sp.]|uniref:glycosyltransferase family 2 protein n=1 Tax=uncultured Rubinisphaera sp. TaxID=1678686 RepID=UPI0030DCCC74